MKLEFFIGKLLSAFSVQNLLQRTDLMERIRGEKPLPLQEFIYPLLQGYDGVELDVDVEIGGNDQTFNMNVGRALRETFAKSRPEMRQGKKFFIATTLLVNPKTGKKLMNKSEGGLINLDDKPEEMFGKVMALGDESMFAVGELSSEIDLSRIKELKQLVEDGRMNPRDAKLEVAVAIVQTIYGDELAKKAKEKWERKYSEGEISPTELKELKVRPTDSAMDIVRNSGFVWGNSKSEASRFIVQGGLSVNGKKILDPHTIPYPTLKNGDVLAFGKKKDSLRVKKVR